ncbi:Rrf2 family transcriptional regulator [Variovorax saccharolyticus]|uniref:Rrf2 family transcriptional regulator n=1 Tax=Variovorax saccharolyticus TaxID=3053516 RepID=UPI0025773E7A|nr:MULTISPECIES: Rrf2 family transcriptional regulator [unclassified Variovorax]MDM0021996.1 Rrf2 family transcriptional regulator [Variovorax sp. J22R187]MDM0028959.1 Rrf2 family transcriptional regulator [Variovorax sp. J31P216]
MRLTTKGRFAVIAMIDVALNGRNGPVNLSSIHQRQRISLSYLEQLFGKLRRQGLVESTRGPGGGYSLGRSATEINVADIILSIDDEAELKSRPQRPDAPGAVHRCTTDELWDSVNRRAVEFLQSVSLQSLVDEQISKGITAARKISVPVVPGRVKSPPVNAPNSVFAMGALLAKRG